MEVPLQWEPDMLEGMHIREQLRGCILQLVFDTRANFRIAESESVGVTFVAELREESSISVIVRKIVGVEFCIGDSRDTCDGHVAKPISGSRRDQMLESR